MTRLPVAVHLQCCVPARDQGIQPVSCGGGDVGAPPNQRAFSPPLKGLRRTSALPELRKNQTICLKIRSKKNVLDGGGESWGNNGYHEKKRSSEGCVHCA